MSEDDDDSVDASIELISFVNVYPLFLVAKIAQQTPPEPTQQNAPHQRALFVAKNVDEACPIDRSIGRVAFCVSCPNIAECVTTPNDNHCCVCVDYTSDWMCKSVSICCDAARVVLTTTTKSTSVTTDRPQRSCHCCCGEVVVLLMLA
jgi:hypothetical protein